jgi:DNA-binding response OmpR family regulator
MAEVLVVDDQKVLCDVVCKALVKAGHTCAAAQDGEEAVSLLVRRPFDLVLTDLKMPKLGGIGLIEWLHEKSPATPVIIMTGFADLESARKAMRLGVADYLVKPFEGLGEVQAAVDRAIATRAARADADSLRRELEERAMEADVRERRLTGALERAEAELTSLARRLEESKAVASRQVAELALNIEGGLVVTDSEGVVLSMNSELLRQLEVTSPAVAGVAVGRLPGDSALRDAVMESLALLKAGSADPVVATTSDRAGREHVYQVRSMAVRDADGGPSGAVTVVRRAPAGRATTPVSRDEVAARGRAAHFA